MTYRAQCRRALLFVLRLLISEKSKNALRVALVCAAVTVTIFFAVLRSRLECYTNILAYVALVIIAQHPHIGAVLRAGVILSLASLIATIFALVGLAMADKSAAALYFICLVLATIATILRTDTNPISLGMGITINFLFGAVFILYVKTPPSEAWNRTYPTLLSGLFASVAALLGAILIFPKSARRALRRGLAQSLRETGELLLDLRETLLTPVKERQFSISIESEMGGPDFAHDALAKVQALRAAFSQHRMMLSYMPFEPNLWPPWQCEPDQAWGRLLNTAEDFLFQVDAIVCVFANEQAFLSEALSKLFSDSIQALIDYLEAAQKSALKLSECIQVYPRHFDTEVALTSTMRTELNRVIARARHRRWRELQFEDRESDVNPTTAYEFASLMFVAYNVRALQRSIESLQGSVAALLAERRRLRYAPIANLFRWIPIIVKAPIQSWMKTHVLLRNPDNLKFLIKYILCVAIILFPTLFVSQFSYQVYSFLQHDNAISAYIIVTILFMRGVEMTLFRVFLYFTVTFASCALAYALTVMAPTDPYVIDMWIGVWTWGALLVASIDPAYIVATFPFLLAQYFIIGCQFGLGFTFVYAASRAVSVSCGCFVVAAVSVLLWPYRSEEEVRELLSRIFKSIIQMLVETTEAFVQMNKEGSKATWEEHGGANVESTIRQTETLITVTNLRMVLDITPNYRKTSLPQGVGWVSLLMRRFLLLRQVVRASPQIRGSYSTTAYEVFLKHLEPELNSTLRQWERTAALAAERLRARRSERPPPGMLVEALADLRKARDALVAKYALIRSGMLRHWRQSLSALRESPASPELSRRGTAQRNHLDSSMEVPRDSNDRANIGLAQQEGVAAIVPTEEIDHASRAGNADHEPATDPLADRVDSLELGPPDLLPDDSVRFLAWLYAMRLMYSAFDCVVEAICALRYGPRRRSRWQRCWRKLTGRRGSMSEHNSPPTLAADDPQGMQTEPAPASEPSKFHQRSSSSEHEPAVSRNDTDAEMRRDELQQ
ncbi:hypothetical protein CCYA_CCYA01G0384 [Cyanidiococcus yangmingshanensis]|nr:hypothetical protein CCYA_CCYA01G0384 [Cyanidiococcus yangmingshanensis]